MRIAFLEIYDFPFLLSLVFPPRSYHERQSGFLFLNLLVASNVLGSSLRLPLF